MTEMEYIPPIKVVHIPTCYVPDEEFTKVNIRKWIREHKVKTGEKPRICVIRFPHMDIMKSWINPKLMVELTDTEKEASNQMISKLREEYPVKLYDWMQFDGVVFTYA